MLTEAEVGVPCSPIPASWVLGQQACTIRPGCPFLSYGELNKDNVSSPRGAAVYSPRAHLNLSFANSSGILGCRGTDSVVPEIQLGVPHPMLASHPLEESPCAWPLGAAGGAERGWGQISPTGLGP